MVKRQVRQPRAPVIDRGVVTTSQEPPTKSQLIVGFLDVNLERICSTEHQKSKIENS